MKEYISPEIDVTKIAVEQMLTGSIDLEIVTDADVLDAE